MPPFKDDGGENGAAPHIDQLSHWEGEEAPEPSTGASSMQVRSRSGSDEGEDGRAPLPIWMRESSKSFRWRWVPLRIRKAARSIAMWSKGPDPPQIQKISPFFPSIQEAPARIIDKYFPKKRHKAGLFAFFYFCWVLTFSLVLHHSASAGNIKGYGKPRPVSCTASYWSVKEIKRHLQGLIFTGRQTMAVVWMGSGVGRLTTAPLLSDVPPTAKQ
ncbi:MAG: hypothetical protein Q9190_006650 [Brigantiaea leucoxantha]